MRKHLIHRIALSEILVAGLAAGSAYAQDTTQAPPPDQQAATAQGHGRHRAPDPDKQAAHMAKKLNLSADQQNQIKPILADRQQQMQGLWQDQSLTRQDRRDKMKSIHDDTNAKIEAILNDQQKQKYEAMMAKMEARRDAMKQRHAQRGAETAPAPQQ